MSSTLTDKLIDTHRIDGSTVPGHAVALGIDQTLTQDATGTLVMLELEAMGIDRVQTELSAHTSTTTCSRRTTRTPTIIFSWPVPAGALGSLQPAGKWRQPPRTHAAIRPAR